MTEAQKLALEKLGDVYLLLRQEKPGDRSDLDRHYAICITELEKFVALFRGLIVDPKEVINE
jgi:hypothetical protein